MALLTQEDAHDELSGECYPVHKFGIFGQHLSHLITRSLLSRALCTSIGLSNPYSCPLIHHFFYLLSCFRAVSSSCLFV